MKPLLQSIVGDYEYRLTVRAASLTPSLIADPASDRVLLMVGNNHPVGDCGVSLRSDATPEVYLPVNNETGPLTMTARDHPGIIWGPWYAYSTGTESITVTEVFYRPKG